MRFATWAILIVASTLTGCGPGLKTHAVKGRVFLPEGNIEDLKESHVEFELASDSTVRGSGLISSDGSFRVEMLHKGTVLKGLPPGTYRARVILADDGLAAKKAWAAVPLTYLSFTTSGISITVPSREDVVITIAKT